MTHYRVVTNGYAYRVQYRLMRFWWDNVSALGLTPVFETYEEALAKALELEERRRRRRLQWLPVESQQPKGCSDDQ